MSAQISALLDHGFTIRFPARVYERFDAEAARNVIGSETWVDTNEVGVHERVRMEVADAWVENGGLVMVLRPIPLR
jgi:hypothetical protein